MSSVTENDVASCWNKNAAQWISDIQSGNDIHRDLFTFPAFQKFLPNLIGLDVIDFGCGEGSNTRQFAKMGAKVTGLDLSEDLIKHARQTEKKDPMGVTYKIVSYTSDTGLPASSFDAVLSTMALMDGSNLQGAMDEAYRLLRPGGFIAFNVLHPCFMTPGWQWVKNENDHTTGICVANYFNRSSFTEEWTFGNRSKEQDVEPFSVPRFPRTIGDYINSVATAGFHIVQIAEPQPTDEACKAFPTLTRWRDIGAFALLVLAKKPS